jgi:hypothetical protein
MVCPCGCGESFAMTFCRRLDRTWKFSSAQHIGAHDDGEEVYLYSYTIGFEGVRKLEAACFALHSKEEDNAQT